MDILLLILYVYYFLLVVCYTHLLFLIDGWSTCLTSALYAHCNPSLVQPIYADDRLRTTECIRFLYYNT